MVLLKDFALFFTTMKPQGLLPISVKKALKGNYSAYM